MKRLLTVCLGNHCRSPFAQAALARRSGDAVEVRSAGLIGKWAGHAAHPAMVEAARRLGHDLTGHRGRQISMELLDWADTVLAMDGAVLEVLLTITTKEQAAKCRLYLDGRDVPDPVSGSPKVFNDCAILIEAATVLHLP